MYDSKALATLLASELDTKKAKDVSLIYIGNVSDLADYFVICTAASPLHIQALADACERCASEGDVALNHKEGTEESGWVLLDFPNVIVHIFLQEQRERYDLEHLWQDGVSMRPNAPRTTLGVGHMNGCGVRWMLTR